MSHLKSILSWPSCILFPAVVNNGALNTEGSHLLRKGFSIPLGPYPVAGPLGYAVILSSPPRILNTAFQNGANSQSYQECTGIPLSLHPVNTYIVHHLTSVS